MSIPCLLCQSSLVKKREVTAKPSGNYWHCQVCDYTFRDPSERLSPSAEKERYHLHENIDTEGYRRFLSPAVQAVQGGFRADQRRALQHQGGLQGLDFGCGPTAFFSSLLAESGIELLSYDPFFYDRPELLARRYHFIVSTEVFEHLFTPSETLDLLHQLLLPGGALIIMTSLLSDHITFDTWSYRRDSTHVGFFSEKTFRFIAKKWNLDLVETSDPLVVMRKKP